MSAYNLVPAWKLHSIRAKNTRRERLAEPPLAPAFPIADLPFLTRRVLRIIAEKPGIMLAELDRLADLETRDSARTTADALVLHGLAQRAGVRSDGLHYTLTRAGQQTLLQSHTEADRDIGLRVALYLDLN